jgi:hypothetical protein
MITKAEATFKRAKQNQVQMREAQELRDAQQAADALTDYVNVLGRKYGAFVTAILGSHRTLQQNVMRMFMQLVKAWSEVEFTDMRNEGTVTLAKQIMEAVGDRVYLPHV